MYEKMLRNGVAIIKSSGIGTSPPWIPSTPREGRKEKNYMKKKARREDEK